MKDSPYIEIRIGRGAIVALALLLTFGLAMFVLPAKVGAQKTQENFRDKFKIASETGGVGIATSADGKFVYVVGPEGILASDDFGKTGSWTQTARMK